MSRDKRSQFISENLALVHSLAHRFKGRGIEYDDLFAAGCVGLLKAYDSFDEERGFKFSTYAVPVILGEIKRLFRDGGTVKVSRSIKELSLKIIREKEIYEKKYLKEPTINQLAEIIGVSTEEVAEAVSASQPTLSLTASEEWEEGQIDVAVEGEEEKLTDIMALQQALTGLEERDKQLITLRYYKNKTQSQTAKMLGMTQVQVSRREKKILEIMRQRLA